MFNIRKEGPLHVVYDEATGVTIKECATAREAAIYAATEKAGDVANLGKHLLNKYGDEHLFTACMGDDATAEYDADTRAAVCARAHHEATGKWPTQKEIKEVRDMDITEKAEWSAAQVNDLPDSSFLYVESGGDKDEGGNTTPRLNIFERVLSAIGGKEGRRNATTDQDHLDQAHDHLVQAGAHCPMMVMKQSNGKARWILVSTNAYEDRDGEYVSLKAQKRDVKYLNETKEFGPLRLWHLGYPDADKKEAGPGVDIGDCDYSQMFGKFRIESGTFRNERVAVAIKDRADKWATSLGFFHPVDEPDRNGIYHEMHTFERSLLPRTKASNLLTPLAAIIKEFSMTTKEEKVKQLADLLGDDKLAGEVLGQVETMEKEAQKRGLTFKQQGDPAVAEKTSAKKVGVPQDDKEPDEDDLGDMDEATQKSYKAMLPHIVKAIHNLTKKDNIEGASKKERKAAKKERKAVDARLDQITQALAELKGELPRGLAKGGFQPSQSGENLINLMGASALKEASPDPVIEFMKHMQMAVGSNDQPGGNGQQ